MNVINGRHFVQFGLTFTGYSFAMIKYSGDTLFMDSFGKFWSGVVVSLLPIVLILSPISAHSDIPQIINYNGQLSNSTGTPIDTTVSIAFNIYEDANNDGAADGAAIWSETHGSVVVTDGLFSTALGSVNTAAGTTLGELKFNTPYLLGINVNSDGEMGLLRLTSAPTALSAENTQGSSVAVNCASDSIQAALDAGATTVSITGVCAEAVTITRNGVTLSAAVPGAGITGPSDSEPALKIIGASQVSIQGLIITEASGSTDEACVGTVSGAGVSFSGVTVENCPDIGVAVTHNSSATFDGAASVISNAVVGLEIDSGSNAALGNISIQDPLSEGIFVGAKSSLFMGNEGNGAPAISTTFTDAIGLVIEGGSSVAMDLASISSTNGQGVRISGNSSLIGYGDGPAGTSIISGGNGGIVLISGSVRMESSTLSISSVNGNRS